MAIIRGLTKKTNSKFLYISELVTNILKVSLYIKTHKTITIIEKNTPIIAPNNVFKKALNKKSEAM